MAFDGRGRRIIKVAVQQSGNNRMYTIYAGTKIVSEFTDASTATYNSGTTPGQAPSDTVSTLLYQHQDQLTTREATDNFANVAYQRGDFPYGDQWYDTGTASLSVMRKYTSYQMEPELSGSLNYAMAREHSARLGRFHTPDPHPPARNRDPQRLNRYSYVGGDPINHEDPTGRFIAGVAAGCVEDSLDGWDGFLLGPTGGPTPDDINCAAILLLPPQPPPCLPTVSAPISFAASCSPPGGAPNYPSTVRITIGGYDVAAGNAHDISVKTDTDNIIMIKLIGDARVSSFSTPKNVVWEQLFQAYKGPKIPSNGSINWTVTYQCYGVNYTAKRSTEVQCR